MKKQIRRTFCALAGIIALGASSAQAAEKDIVDTAVAAGDFKILTKALKATGLDKALKSKGRFTVFAPTDKAFMRLTRGTIETLLKPENKERLKGILTYHVVLGDVSGSTAVKLNDAKTFNGEKVNISFKNAALYINSARVTATDIKAKNGVIHVIDNVLIPKNLAPANTLAQGKSAVSKKILVNAINVGVELFNGGNEKACASIYNIAVTAILEIKPKELKGKDLEMIRKTLIKASGSDDQRANAWALRRTMNAILNKLEK